MSMGRCHLTLQRKWCWLPPWEDGAFSCHQSSPRSSYPILPLLVPALGTQSGMPGTPFAAAWAVGSDAPTAAWCHFIALFCPRHALLLPSHPASYPRLYLGLSEVFVAQRASPFSRVEKAHRLSSEIHGRNMVPSSGGFSQLQSLRVLKARLLRYCVFPIKTWGKHQFAGDGWPLVADSCKPVSYPTSTPAFFHQMPHRF